MHQTVQVASAFLDLFSHILVDFHVKHVGDKVECILVVLDFSIESCQVESVREIVFVNLAKVLVAA